MVSGFHLTLRAVEPWDSVAFGRRRCHGHQPSGFNEKPGHPGNIFWHQAQKVHEVYRMLDGKRHAKARVRDGMPWYEFEGKIDRRVILPDSKLDRPLEPDVRFRGDGGRLPGLPVEEMTKDQQEAVQRVLVSLLAPYHTEYKEQVTACFKKQGGLAKCRLAFYEEHQVNKEGQWDNWRLKVRRSSGSSAEFPTCTSGFTWLRTRQRTSRRISGDARRPYVPGDRYDWSAIARQCGTTRPRERGNGVGWPRGAPAAGARQGPFYGARGLAGGSLVDQPGTPVLRRTAVRSRSDSVCLRAETANPVVARPVSTPSTPVRCRDADKEFHFVSKLPAE